MTDIILNIFVPFAMFIVMVIIGMDLSKEDFKRVAIYPKAILIGTISQMLLLPLLGAFVLYTIPEITPLSDLDIGALIIFAACPGGGISNIMTAQARGNVALSVSYTALSSVLAIVTIPVIAGIGFTLFLADPTSISVPLLAMIGQLVVFVVIPIIAGITIRDRNPEFVKRHSKNFNRFINLFIIALIASGFNIESGISTDTILNALPAAMCFSIGSVLIGLIVVSISGMEYKDRVALLIEFSVRHAGIATIIILFILDRFEMMAMLSACILVQLSIVVILVIIMRLFFKQESKKSLEESTN